VILVQLLLPRGRAPTEGMQSMRAALGKVRPHSYDTILIN